MIRRVASLFFELSGREREYHKGHVEVHMTKDGSYVFISGHNGNSQDQTTWAALEPDEVLELIDVLWQAINPDERDKP